MDFPAYPPHYSQNHSLSIRPSYIMDQGGMVHEVPLQANPEETTIRRAMRGKSKGAILGRLDKRMPKGKTTAKMPP